jgi:hypothetical protein
VFAPGMLLRPSGFLAPFVFSSMMRPAEGPVQGCSSCVRHQTTPQQARCWQVHAKPSAPGTRPPMLVQRRPHTYIHDEQQACFCCWHYAHHQGCGGSAPAPAALPHPPAAASLLPAAVVSSAVSDRSAQSSPPAVATVAASTLCSF